MSNGIVLKYQLNSTVTADKWLGMIHQCSKADLLRTEENHRHGFADDDLIESNISRLRATAEELGYTLDNLTSQNWQTELTTLHLNFASRKISVIKNIKKAHDLNLLIHWLEYELGNKYNGKQQHLFNLDFNHNRQTYKLIKPIPRDEMSMFSDELKFGSIHLHYLYVGRHFKEMVDAYDLITPADQFRPQHDFNPTCGLVFSEPNQSDQSRQYYDERGGKEFFTYDFDDVRLAKGFFQLGTLENINEFNTLEARNNLRETIKNAEIVSWN